MQRYSEYKDSGVQWLGEIPSHWEVKRLRNFLTLFSEKGFGDSQLLSVTRERGVILRDKENKEENHNFVPDDLNGYKHLYAGDFVVNKMKSWQGSYGVSDYEGIVSPAYFTCKLKGVNPKFFSRAIRSKAYIGFFMQYSKGIRVDQWDLDPNSMKDIPFVLPNEVEQEAIANYLDSITSKIDTAIAQQQKMIDLLNERKQIIINNAVTKGLDPNAKMKDSGVEWIGEIPEHWEVRRLKHIFVRIADGTHFSPQIVLEGYPYITATDVDGKVIDYEKVKRISSKDFESLVRAGCKPKMGDILLVKDGATTGRVGMKSDSVDCVLLSSVAMLTPSTRSNGDFLMFMMMSDMLQKQIALSMAGAALPRITLIKLSNFLGVIPPHKEQIEIAEFVERKINPLKETILTIEQKINLLQERKQIIINDVVTGKVKVV